MTCFRQWWISNSSIVISVAKYIKIRAIENINISPQGSNKTGTVCFSGFSPLRHEYSALVAEQQMNKGPSVKSAVLINLQFSTGWQSCCFHIHRFRFCCWLRHETISEYIYIYILIRISGSHEQFLMHAICYTYMAFSSNGQ